MLLSADEHPAELDAKLASADEGVNSPLAMDSGGESQIGADNLDLESDSDCAVKPLSGLDLDVSLASLLDHGDDERLHGEGQDASDPNHSGESSDLFGRSDDSASSSSSSSSSLSSLGDESDGKQPKKGAKTARKKCTVDLSHTMPLGCSLRRYERESKRAYWLGVLPEGVVDPLGRHSRTRCYGISSRPEIEAQGDVETWLLTNAPPKSDEDEDDEDDDDA